MSKTTGSTQLRVLHVLSNLGIGGAEVWLLALLRYFREQEAQTGIHVASDVFLTHGITDKLDDEVKETGARLVYASYSRKTLPSFISSWRATLKSGRYHAIHDHQEFSAGWHFLFGLGLLPPVRIAHLHNPMTHQESYSSGWLRRKTIAMGNWAIGRYGTHLLSTSRQLITEQGFDDLPAARAIHKEELYCGFDTARFAGEREAAQRQLRAELGLKSQTHILLFVGRLDSHSDEAKNQKNPAFCLEVARRCAARDANFVCLIVGSGDEMRKRLEDRVEGWGVSSQIRFLGPRRDVPELMLGSDLLILPSIAEGLGMVAVEAQAAGLPVLASTAVPRECQVVPGMVQFLALDEGEEIWADEVLNSHRKTLPSHEVANHAVRDSRFSIQSSANRLLDLYRSGARADH